MVLCRKAFPAIHVERQLVRRASVCDSCRTDVCQCRRYRACHRGVCGKGIPIGTAIAFMMAVVGLSLPEATLLKKVMTWKLIGIFFGTVAFFIILSGYLFNYIL